MEKVMLQEDDVEYIINILNKTQDKEIPMERYNIIIKRLNKIKNDIINSKQNRKLSKHTREMQRLYSRIYYYLNKKYKDDKDYIKLQMYVEKFNNVSYSKKIKIIDGQIVSENKE